nr:uncharacterized protein LOC109174495 [Ipomoea batatas]
MEQLRRWMDELQRKLEARERSPEPQEGVPIPNRQGLYGVGRPPSMMAGASDAVMCRGFFVTLDGQAQDWFTSLPEKSISTFADLSGKFLTYYADSIPKKKQFANMCKLEQWSMETLTDYLIRWKKAARSVENFDEKAAIPIFTNNVRSGPFHSDLVQNRPKMYAALLDRAASHGVTARLTPVVTVRPTSGSPPRMTSWSYTADLRPEPCAPDDLEAMNDPEALDDPEAVGGLKTAANLEALGVKAKHKSHGVKAKHKFRGTWNQKVEDDLEAVNDPEALDDLEAVRPTSRHVSWREGKTQVSWREGKTEVSWVRSTKTRPSGTWNTKEVVDDPEAVADPGTVGSHALGLNPQSRPNGTPPWRTRASATQHSKTPTTIVIPDDPGVARDNIWRRFFRAWIIFGAMILGVAAWLGV